MPRGTLLAVCLMTVVVLVACGESEATDPGFETPGPFPSVTQEPPRATAPTGTRTGIPDIDTVLDAVFSGDEDAVEALIQYNQVACVTQPFGLGSPPQCREGEPEGTLSDFFAVGYCHGELVRPENMGGVIATLSRPGARLRAVSAVDEVWPAGDHVIVYDHVRGPEEQYDPEVILGGSNRIPHNALILVLREGAIAGILSGCQGTPEEFLDGRNLDPLLFIPPDGLTGIRELDMVLDGLVLNDPGVLGAFITFQAIPCITTPEGIGAPPLCTEHELPGTRVEAFPLSTCELEYRRRGELADVRERLADAELYAVYAENSRHVVLMSSQAPDQLQAVRLFIEGRLIVEIDFTCILTPEEALAEVPEADILAGPLPP